MYRYIALNTVNHYNCSYITLTLSFFLNKGTKKKQKKKHPSIRFLKAPVLHSDSQGGSGACPNSFFTIVTDAWTSQLAS